MAGAAVLAASGVFLAVSGTAQAEETREIAYRVSFVAAGDHNIKIFNTQEGEVPEGTALRVSFPEQIAGSDGHIWHSLEKTPQEFPVYQDGVHKYYIEYQQGERVKTPEKEENAQKERLDRWLLKAWEADCALTGQDPDGIRDSDRIVTQDTSNNRRIRNLVSIISDGAWHSFYLIGKDYTPKTLIVGTEFDALYSVVKADSFSFEGSLYEVYRVSVKRNWAPERCTHSWSMTGRAEKGCLEFGTESWKCEKCQTEETVFLPAPGHLDEDGDALCDRCGLSVSPGEENGAEKRRWVQGEIQMRRVGKEVYRFRCIDEDYRDVRDGHRKSALFLCDRVIRADIEGDKAGDGRENEVLSFGRDNNYKTSAIRSWLNENRTEGGFGMEPVFIGVDKAYTGSSAAGSFVQLSDGDFACREIGFQLMQDSLFCLSLEEALRYRAWLWQFGDQGPESQISAYSAGYYLRTPFYEEKDAGGFRYGNRIYAVDLENGNIHPVDTESENYGMRPAFTLPQE